MFRGVRFHEGEGKSLYSGEIMRLAREEPCAADWKVIKIHLASTPTVEPDRGKCSHSKAADGRSEPAD